MRICFIGAQSTGKTTTIDAFIKTWPQYKVVVPSYKELVKEKKLTLNQVGTKESQLLIRDSLIDDTFKYAADPKAKVVFDRCIIDNLVYTLWLADQELIKDDEFVSTTFKLVRETCKFYDMILWTPINPELPINSVGNDQRSTDPSYRIEINHIFESIYDSYLKGEGWIFDPNDQPTIIPLVGNLQERIDTIAQYLDNDGNLINTEKSVLTTLQEVYDEEMLRKSLLGK